MPQKIRTVRANNAAIAPGKEKREKTKKAEIPVGTNEISVCLHIGIFRQMAYNIRCYDTDERKYRLVCGTNTTMSQPRRIIDFHVHIFPEKIAAKAVAATGGYYGITMDHNGTIPDLLASGARINCSRYLVHSTATRPDQVVSVNDFICHAAAEHPEFIPFGTLHPKMENLEAEVDRIIANGVYGVKMHPDFQDFKVDDEDVLYMYAVLAGRLPVLLHMGDINTDKTTPERLYNVINRFPNLTVIGAHFSGYSVWDRAENVLKGTGIYVDTSSSLPFLTPERATELVHAFGADHCLFGTDYPMWDHEEELARFMALALTETEREMILHENAERLLNL